MKACGPEPTTEWIAHCHAIVAMAGTNVFRSPSPAGLSPAVIKQVYGWTTDPTAGKGRTIAIVDAYDDPTAESDLALFSQTFGLPPCTTANGCFTKVDQTGGTALPKRNLTWSFEISLDVQWAHAIAPGAKILLVEARSSRGQNVFAAVDYAKQHAQEVSMSWGGHEFAAEQTVDPTFVVPGVSFFAAAGDGGATTQYPSVSPNVVSVGGTQLDFDSQGNFSVETAWSFTGRSHVAGGGGCAKFEAAPPAQQQFMQHDMAITCSARATPDFSLDASLASGLSVVFTPRPQIINRWIIVGGTSASAPMAAARAATTGIVVNADVIYGSAMTFRDITFGFNGTPCVVGYDECTGRGSWVGARP